MESSLSYPAIKANLSLCRAQLREICEGGHDKAVMSVPPQEKDFDMQFCAAFDELQAFRDTGLAPDEMPQLKSEVERLTDQHKCDVHNIAAMRTTLDQQAKNCEELIESYKKSNLEQATENYELEKENATLKKALELACDGTPDCPANGEDETPFSECKDCKGEKDFAKCYYRYFIQQVQQTHETQEAEK